MPGVSKRSSATKLLRLLSNHPNGQEDAHEHDLKSMGLRSKHRGADLPSTSPSCVDCKRRSEQRYYRGHAQLPVNVAVPLHVVVPIFAAIRASNLLVVHQIHV